ncbi:DUF2510 domain-containing protein [Ammonicoccus fulvus]|uniref:DUF2510 domain-containing protein n=1 Tax=Ammonicoccus fulvus TaxID=3138240 RepID=A0ABZ3FS49_9ACTN
MQSPGWYPDPSGQPHSFRFWDGNAWTPVTTQDPNTPWPRPDQIGTFPQGGTGVARTAGKSRTPVIIAVAAAVVLALVALGGIFLTRGNGGGEGPTVSPAPASPGAATPGAATTPASAPTAGTGGDPVSPPQVTCTGGNDSYTRNRMETYTSTGVRYDGVPDWGFSFDRSYWTWLDDYSAMGDINLDGKKNEAGIVLGGVRFDNGFVVQEQAGALIASCLEGTLSVEEKTTAGPVTTEEMTLGGMKTYRTQLDYTAASADAPLKVSIYVIDSGQPRKWAQIITFHRPGSSAEPLIERALQSVRHI